MYCSLHFYINMVNNISFIWDSVKPYSLFVKNKYSLLVDLTCVNYIYIRSVFTTHLKNFYDSTVHYSRLHVVILFGVILITNGRTKIGGLLSVI